MIFYLLPILISLNVHSLEDKFCFYSADSVLSKLQSLDAQANLMHAELLESGLKSTYESDLTDSELTHCMLVKSGPQLMKKIKAHYQEVMHGNPIPGKPLEDSFDVIMVYETPQGNMNQVFFSYPEEKEGVYYNARQEPIKLAATRVHKEIVEYTSRGPASNLKAHFGLGRKEKTFPEKSEKYFLLVNGKYEAYKIKSFYALPRN